MRALVYRNQEDVFSTANTWNAALLDDALAVVSTTCPPTLALTLSVKLHSHDFVFK